MAIHTATDLKSNLGQHIAGYTGIKQIIDIIDTMVARTGNGVMNLVTAPEFSADPTGILDSTAAFAAALAGGNTAIVPPGTYRLDNLVVPSGSSIIGGAPIGYGTAYGAGTKTVLAALNSSTVRILNVSGATNIRISGVQLDADYNGNSVQNTTCDCISAGCNVLCLDNVTVRFGRYGVGGAVGGGNAWNVVVIGSQFQAYGCVAGLGDILDGYFTNILLSYCTNGAVFTSVSGAINITGGRVEWNTGDGIQIGCSNVMLEGVFFDRNYVAALYLNSNFMTVCSGYHFQRNGRNLDSSSCHVRLNNATNATFTGCISRYGQDDGGTGSFSPAVWMREVGTQSGAISLVGCDLSGTTATQPQTLANFFTGTLPVNFNVSNNFGLLLDEKLNGRPWIRGGFVMQDYYEADIAASGTVTQIFYHDPLASFTCESFGIRLTVRDGTTGGVHAAEFRVLIDREGTTPVLTMSAVIGEIGSAGYIAWASGTISLSWTTIAADGSSYVLSMHNTSGTDNFHIRVQIL